MTKPAPHREDGGDGDNADAATVSQHRSIVDSGPAFPAWVLRAGIGMVAAAILLIVALDGAPVSLVGFGVLIAFAVVALPASPAASVLLVGAALLVTVRGADPFRWQVLALLPTSHLLHIGTAVAAVVPWRARISVAAFRRPALRFLLIQLVVFALVGIAALIPVTTTPIPLEVLGIAIAFALVSLLLKLVWTTRRK